MSECIFKIVIIIINELVFIWLSQVLVTACGIFSCSMQTPSCGTWDPIPHQGSNPSPLHWKHGVLVTGPPKKSRVNVFLTGIDLLYQR